MITRSPEDGNKQIRYRYDMGTNWDWLLDQDFKAKIKYYENRRSGGLIKGRTRWRKSDGLLDVDFDGDVYARDEDDCVCQESRSLLATPVDKRDKQHTFRDDLSRSAFGTGKTHWIKDESPIFIEYKVDGVTYVIQHCQDTPGFHCE